MKGRSGTRAVDGAPVSRHRGSLRPTDARDTDGGDRLDAIAPAARTGFLADTAVRIGLAVDLGLLQPNERLPAEKELASTFGVSRMTTRRALQLLSERGVLVRRRGRSGGTFVAADPPRRGLGEFEAYRTASGEVFDLIDHRLVIECGAVHLAAGTATAHDVERLWALVREMDAAQTWTAFRAVDPRFHLAVAAIAGSAGAVRELADVLARLFRFYVPYPIAYLHASNREHEALVDAIEAGDRAGAVAVIERHIVELRQTVFVEPEPLARHVPDKVAAGLDAVLEQLGQPDADKFRVAAAHRTLRAAER
jgi:DNA-binding FadR family transcriptional regulator